MNAKQALDEEYKAYLEYRRENMADNLPVMGFHDWRMIRTNIYQVPAAEWTEEYLRDAAKARVFTNVTVQKGEGGYQRVPVVKLDDAIGIMTEMWHTLSQLKRPVFKLSPEGHYIWTEAIWDQRIMCDCGDPGCYAAIVPLPESTLAIFRDASDEDEGAFPFTLPQKYMLVERVKLHEPIQSA